MQASSLTRGLPDLLEASPSNSWDASERGRRPSERVIERRAKRAVTFCWLGLAFFFSGLAWLFFYSCSMDFDSGERGRRPSEQVIFVLFSFSMGSSVCLFLLFLSLCCFLVFYLMWI